MPDATDQPQQLADLFTKLAAEVDAFRSAHYDELSPQQRGHLEEKIQQLYDFHDQFAGDAIQNTINALKGDLTQLNNVTRQAADALKHLNSVAQVVNIVSAASTIASDVMTADYGAIPEAVRLFVQAVQAPSDKTPSGS
jgi:5-methylcytosine-specific restriction endonuclease McrBC regulatory subunit McrC